MAFYPTNIGSSGGSGSILLPELSLSAGTSSTASSSYAVFDISNARTVSFIWGKTWYANFYVYVDDTLVFSHTTRANLSDQEYSYAFSNNSTLKLTGGHLNNDANCIIRNLIIS